MGSGGDFDNFIIKHFIGVFLYCTIHITEMFQNTFVKIPTTTHIHLDNKVRYRPWKSGPNLCVTLEVPVWCNEVVATFVSVKRTLGVEVGKHDIGLVTVI